MEKSGAARFLSLLDKMSALVFLFVILFGIYFITRYMNCRRGVLSRGRLFRYSEGEATEGSSGLDREIRDNLPILVFKPKAFKTLNAMECAVCLCEFQENQKARILPNCKHSFHIECIDMWFFSHSTCPLCRAKVEVYPSAKMADSASAETGV